jgi:hypothetical protein
VALGCRAARPFGPERWKRDPWQSPIELGSVNSSLNASKQIRFRTFRLTFRGKHTRRVNDSRLSKPARPSIRQGEEEPVLLALVIALLEFLVYGSGDLRNHASPNHSRASLNLIVEPGLYMLLSFQKASCARKL